MREGRSSAHPPKPIVPAVRPLVGATGPGQSMALTSISISVASTARLPATTYPKPHTSVSAKASLHGRACKIVCENSRTSTRTMHSSVPDRRVPNKRYNQPPHSCCPTNERLDANGLLQQALASLAASRRLTPDGDTARAASPHPSSSYCVRVSFWLVKGRESRHHLSILNIYLRLTEEFNEGELRAVICSGQAVVLHRLAIMSKDGDWILREHDSALEHVLGVLERHGARYRYGAPLDTRWMAGAWSSHFEFRQELLRVRTDFFTRPPRISQADLARIWQEQAGRNVPFLDPPDLAEMKKTNRERDYAVIGELARLMEDVELQIRYSRSARDLLSLADQHADRIERIAETRPALRSVAKGRDGLEVALDAERRESIRRNEARLAAYARAASRWYSLWPSVAEAISGLPLTEAHNVVVTRADGVLPRTVDVAKGASYGEK